MSPDEKIPAAISEQGNRDGGKREGSLSSAEIFKGAREVTIVHNGGEYTLRITSSNKLILTK